MLKNRFKGNNMLLYCLFLFLSMIGLSWADPDITVLGQFRNVEPKAECTLAHGVAALESQILENIRTKGNYGPQNKEYPSIHDFRAGVEGGAVDVLKIDWPQGWVEAFLQYLFPSSGLVGLVESTAQYEFAYTLKQNKEMIGRLLAALRNPIVNQNEGMLVGALMEIFDPKDFEKASESELKNHFSINTDGKRLNKEGIDAALKTFRQEKDESAKKKVLGEVRLKTLKSLGEKTLKNIKNYNPKSPKAFAVLTAKAYLNSTDYPPHIVEQAFWTLAWKTSSRAEEIIPVYKGLLGKNIKLEDPSYIKENDYDPFKKQVLEKRAKEEDVTRLANDPFLATYIGAAYSYYDAPLPPNITYGHAQYKGQFFPDCGENSLWNFFNIMLWNKNEKIFKIEILKKIADNLRIETTLIDDDLKRKMPDSTWSKLKQVMWFYSLYPKPVKSQSARNQWASIVSEIPGITYKRPDDSAKPFCEIPGAAGISNMLDVIGALIPDPKLAPAIPSSERFSRLCEIFSSEDNELTWKNSEEKQEIKQNTAMTISFYRNYTKSFEWWFLKGHFDLKTPEIKGRWQDRLGDVLLPLFQKLSTCPQLNFYTSEYKYRFLLEDFSPLFWTLAYGNLHTEDGIKAVITHIFKSQQKTLYVLGEALLKRLPTTDQRIKEFILDRLLYDKEWLEKNGSDWIKGWFKEKQEILEKFEQDAVEMGYKNLLEIIIEQHKNKMAFCSQSLINAALQDRLEIVKFLLEKNIKFIRLDSLNQALSCFAEKGHLEMVKFLVKKGADVNAQNKDNHKGSLTRAAIGGHFDVVKFLVEKGADVIAQNNEPLIGAISSYHPEMVKFLVKKGANVNAKLNDYPVLSRSVDRRDLEMTKFLVEQGADVTNFGYIDKNEIGEYLAKCEDLLRYFHQFKTPYKYFYWAIKTLETPPSDFPGFPKQAVVIGLLETLMGKHFPINEKKLAEGKVAEDILKAIATVATQTHDNSLTDQVWLGLDHKVSDKIQKHRLAVYILETYARTKDLKATEAIITTTTSPLFKDIPVETRKTYAKAAIKKYGALIK